MYCASSTCICSWAKWKRMRVSGCMCLHQCQCFSVSSVTAAPNHCARRTNWIRTLCLGCSPSEGFEHLFMSALESKIIWRVCTGVIVNTQLYFLRIGQDWAPVPPWRASGWLLLASLWFCSDPLCSRWHHTGFGLWVLKTRLETAVKVRTLVSGVASKGILKLWGFFYLLVAMRQRNATFIVSWMLKVILNLEMSCQVCRVINNRI